MQIQAWLMLGILVVMFALLVWDRFPSWLVFMGALTAAMTLRLAPPDALLNGFGNIGVITVAALFPVAAGMYATGAVSLLSQHLIGLPKTLMSAQLKVFPPVAVGSAFLNNTPLVAMMIPVVRDLAGSSTSPRANWGVRISRIRSKAPRSPVRCSPPHLPLTASISLQTWS
jgi:Na+/H+ antiporter NhaD/arsenite permease-like protein